MDQSKDVTWPRPDSTSRESPTEMIYNSALVVLSGGQDSTTCLYLAQQRLARRVHAITFSYGQRHKQEINSACEIAARSQVESFEVITIGNVLKGTSPLVSDQPLEHYADEKALPGGIEKTFVPMRNALFLVLALNRAAVLGCDAIVTGVSEEDYGGYPDCRTEFIDAMREVSATALAESIPRRIHIVTPLMHLDKKATVLLAEELPGCMEALAYSHTCYEGSFPPCRTCHSCLLRQKGFDLAGIKDPLIERAERNLHRTEARIGSQSLDA